MKRFLKNYRLHEHTEALFLLTLGIIIQVLDGSPFDVKERWALAWETEFPREIFSVFTQKIIKTVISIIILIRCLTSVFYMLSGLVVFYCILRETSPKYMLPWLFVSGVKSVLLTFLETLTGVYVCSSIGKVRKVCIEFVVAKGIELFFAIYLWASIRSIHKDLEVYEEIVSEGELLTKMVIHRGNFRRRRARSMIDETTLSKTANLNMFQLKDVPNIIFDMLKTEDELSQDSLISPGMMLSSVSNMGSFDYLKTSLSLGELGVIDLDSFQVAELDDDRNLSPFARAMKFLKLTKEEIQQAKERTSMNKAVRDRVMSREIPKSVIDTKPSSFLLRPHRETEIFAAIPEVEVVKQKPKKKPIRKQPDDLPSESFSEEGSKASEDEFSVVENLEINEGVNQDLQYQSNISPEKVDDDDRPDLWFMTNKTDEVNRIRLFEAHNVRRSDNYERLYQQEYMSIIGPEVFDKESKLVKLTSLSVINTKRYVSEPPQPSTSGAPDVAPPESESAEPPKKPKKKIAFESNIDKNPTTMPLSVIVTNYPIQIDSKIENCEAVYYREMVTNSAELLPVPDSFHGPDFDPLHGCPVEQIAKKVSYSKRNSGTTVKMKHQPYTTGPKLLYSSEGRDDFHKLKIFMIKGTKDGVSDSLSSHRHDPKYSSYRQIQESTVHKAPEGNEVLAVNFYKDEREFIYPPLSEQMLFITDLIKRPIKDILKSYYNLRELNRRYTTHLGKIYSSNSIQQMRLETRRDTSSRHDTLRDISWESIWSSHQEECSTMFSPLEGKRKTVVDNETQVCVTEDGLRSHVSAEAVALSPPKTEKRKTDENNHLPPIYLYGNGNQGCSNSPLESKQTRHKFDSQITINSDENFWASNHSLKENSNNDNALGSALFMQHKPGQNTTGRKYLPRDKILADANSDRTGSDAGTCIYSDGSNESFSLFYSKTADLASPLLDMRRFIYPDHIHYSYKNVNKKGFDVELNRGLPLLVRDSLTLNSTTRRRVETLPDPQTGITRRPMDLTFANSDEFMKQVPNKELLASQRECQPDANASTHVFGSELQELRERSFLEVNYKLRHDLSQKKEQKWLRKFSKEERGRNGNVRHGFSNELNDTSSTHLHSNKGRAGIINNPVVMLQTNHLKKKLQRNQ